MELKEGNVLQYEDGINLIDYLHTIWKWKLLIIIMMILLTGLTIIITMAKYPERYVADVSILLNFPGIEKHQNPDGILFEKEQIISPEILMKALDVMTHSNKNTQVFTEINLRKMIDIRPVVPLGIKKNDDAVVFFPNQFNLTLTMNPNDQLFSRKEAEHILMSIINEYRAVFEKKYGEAPLFLSEFPDNFLVNSDYLDVIYVFKTRVNTFIVFLDSIIKKAGLFRSKETYDSFIDIKGELELIKDINIPTIEANIKEQTLTKDKDSLIHVYRYKVKAFDIERKKKEEEALVAHDLLKYMRQPEKYQQASNVDTNKRETSLQLDSSFIKNLIEQDTTSFLLKSALQAGVEAKKYGVDIEVLEKEIALLNDKKNPGVHEKEKTDYIQKSLMDIKDKIVGLAKRANHLNIEFNKNIINNAVQLFKNIEINKKRDVNIKKIVILASCVSLFLSVILVFFIEYIKNTGPTSRKA